MVVVSQMKYNPKSSDTEQKKPIENRVYFLQNENKSYIGFTNNLPRRIRQHRGEIVGGAKCTTSWKYPEDTEIVAYITGFPTQKLALSYEWHAKRRRGPKRRVLQDVSPMCHHRLYRFFEPLLSDKFKDVKQELRVVLLKHPELQARITEHFDVEVGISE